MDSKGRTMVFIPIHPPCKMTWYETIGLNYSYETKRNSVKILKSDNFMQWILNVYMLSLTSMSQHSHEPQRYKSSRWWVLQLETLVMLHHDLHNFLITHLNETDVNKLGKWPDSTNFRAHSANTLWFKNQPFSCSKRVNSVSIFMGSNEFV